MSIYPSDFVHHIADNTPISSVLRKYIKLIPKGNEFQALCPFHGEKTPSFTINDEKKFYHCFGCGAHGDIFKFLMEYERLSFKEAIERIAKEFGYTLPTISHKDKLEYTVQDSLYRLMEAACKIFEENLGKTSAVLKYLNDRGVSGESISNFRLGYATGREITQYIEANKISANLAIEAGLLVRNTQGIIKDKFLSRLMFPITDRQGRIIGFGGRVLDDRQPKYLNSPETAIFHKRQTLYGLLKQTGRESPPLFVVEGYMDAISLHQSGFKKVVSTMGTAVTDEQINYLIKLSPHIIFCFDGDSAGLKAVHRTCKTFLPHLQPGIDVQFMILNEKNDPDSLIRSGKKNLFTEAPQNALSIVKTLIHCEETLNPSSSTSTVALRRKNILESLDDIKDHFLKSLYKQEMYSYFSEKYFHKKKSTATHETFSAKKILSISNQYQRTIISCLLRFPGLYSEFSENLSRISFENNLQIVFNDIENIILSSEDIEKLDKISNVLLEKYEHSLINEDLCVLFEFIKPTSQYEDARNGLKNLLDYFERSDMFKESIAEMKETLKEDFSEEKWQTFKKLMLNRNSSTSD